MTTDIQGRPLTDDEKALMAAYETLCALVERDMVPCAAAAAREALAALWQACNDLCLTDDRPDC
jgi:hypothetical protein